MRERVEQAPSGVLSATMLTRAVIGVALIVGAMLVLGWSEIRAVARALALLQAARSIAVLDPSQTSPNLEGKLVYVQGRGTAPAEVGDPEFGVKADGLKLRRIAEMYQWEEFEDQRKTSPNMPRGVRYQPVWSERLIDSTSFTIPAGHANPATMPLVSRDFTALGIAVGSYFLSPMMIEQLTAYQPLVLENPKVSGPKLPYVGAPKFYSGMIYYGIQPVQPRIGDLRVRYEWVPEGPLSVLGRKRGMTFLPFRTTDKQVLELAVNGSIPAPALLNERTAGGPVTAGLWFIRGGAWVVLVGAALLLAEVVLPTLHATSRLVPLLGSGIWWFSGVLAFVLEMLCITLSRLAVFIAATPAVAAPVVALGVLVMIACWRLIAPTRVRDEIGRPQPSILPQPERRVAHPRSTLVPGIVPPQPTAIEGEERNRSLTSVARRNEENSAGSGEVESRKDEVQL